MTSVLADAEKIMTGITYRANNRLEKRKSDYGYFFGYDNAAKLTGPPEKVNRVFKDVPWDLIARKAANMESKINTYLKERPNLFDNENFHKKLVHSVADGKGTDFTGPANGWVSPVQAAR